MNPGAWFFIPVFVLGFLGMCCVPFGLWGSSHIERIAFNVALMLIALIVIWVCGAGVYLVVLS